MHTKSATDTATRTASARIMLPLFEPPVAAAAQHEDAGPGQGAEDGGERHADEKQLHRGRLSARPRRAVGSGRDSDPCAVPSLRRRGDAELARGVLLAALAGVALAARLGVWQLDRAAQKLALQASLEARAGAPAARRRRRWRPRRSCRGAAFPPRRAARPLARRAHGLPRQPADGRQGGLLRRHAAAARGPGGRGAGAARLGARNFADRAALPASRRRRARRGRRHLAAAPSRLFEFAGARRAGRSGKMSTLYRSRASPASTCCRSRCIESTTRRQFRDRRPGAALAAARHRRAEALRLRVPVVRHRRGDRLPLCLVPNRPPPAPPRHLTRRRCSASAFTRCLRPTPRRCGGTARGRWLMIAVLLVCAAPVVASYLAYFVIRPQARTNYSELIVPPRSLPASLPLRDASGHAGRAAVAARPVAARRRLRRCLRRALRAQPLAAAPAARDARRREGPGRQALADRRRRRAAARDAAAIAATTPAERAGFAPTTVLRTSRDALAAWLAPAPGRALEDHLYIVDPRGDWMMRAPADADPARLKRDLEKLLRASAGWDRPGR